MKIRFTQNVVIAGMPEFAEGNVYEVEITLADLLVSRGQAVYVSSHIEKKQEPEQEKPKKSSKKS